MQDVEDAGAFRAGHRDRAEDVRIGDGSALQVRPMQHVQHPDALDHRRHPVRLVFPGNQREGAYADGTDQYQDPDEVEAHHEERQGGQRTVHQFVLKQRHHPRENLLRDREQNGRHDTAEQGVNEPNAAARHRVVEHREGQRRGNGSNGCAYALHERERLEIGEDGHAEVVAHRGHGNPDHWHAQRDDPPVPEKPRDARSGIGDVPDPVERRLHAHEHEHRRHKDDTDTHQGQFVRTGGELAHLLEHHVARARQERLEDEAGQQIPGVGELRQQRQHPVHDGDERHHRNHGGERQRGRRRGAAVVPELSRDLAQEPPAVAPRLHPRNRHDSTCAHRSRQRTIGRNPPLSARLG